MKNGIIMYQSKYGATKKYANWLAEITGFDCMVGASPYDEQAFHEIKRRDWADGESEEKKEYYWNKAPHSAGCTRISIPAKKSLSLTTSLL